jgi:ribokinase
LHLTLTGEEGVAPRVLALGDLLLDVTVRFDPLSGEAEAGPDAVRIGPGGSAANFAVHTARLGVGCRFVSRVGRDWPGEMMVRDLQGEGVTPEVTTTPDEPTGRVLIMVSPGGDRRMFSYPGASATLSPDDLDPRWFGGIEAFHLTGYSLLREGPREAALHAISLAREAGVPLISLDPNPGHLISDFGPERFRHLLENLGLDVLIPNYDEGVLLSGEREPERIAAELFSVAPLVVLTLDARGCLVATGEGQTLITSPDVSNVVDVTGAGDAFAAAFIADLIRTRDPVSAGQAGNTLAAQVVQRKGAR